MSPIPKAREGLVLEAKGRPLPFSYFPVTRTNRRYGLYDTVFSVNPWAVMRGAINEEVPAQSRQESVAFLEQAEDFYVAATAGISANPLLTYYSFLNLAKVLIRIRGHDGSLDRARHGLTEKTAGDGTELADSVLTVKDDEGPVNVYPELMERLGQPRPEAEMEYRVTDLLPQIVVGHRIWRESKRGLGERFVAIKRIEFVDDREKKELWLRLYLSSGDLKRYDITRKQLLTEGEIGDLFQEVVAEQPEREDRLMCLEQAQAHSYSGRPTDVVAEMVELMKPKLWRIVSAVPDGGYRRYYLHLRSLESDARISQLASMGLDFLFRLGRQVSAASLRCHSGWFERRLRGRVHLIATRADALPPCVGGVRTGDCPASDRVNRCAVRVGWLRLRSLHLSHFRKAARQQTRGNAVEVSS